ncbi:MAG: alanine--tRNA ligase, partial [Alphaproteobacteria bacterium]|nr:alanine--tRNA ligase [Alphaproteobacteria bacterium]
MKNKTLNEVRKAYLDFFESKQHTIVKSSATIPDNDPTLMFTVAGMVQFKDVLTGKEKRDYVRAASCQKCVRAGGKHNDLENVGYTARHHTFFEMLGNWSFGDYFKKEAIEWSYEFLTKVLGLDEDKLLATVYHTDEESYKIWKELTGWGDDKIIRIDTKDNFWEMGDTGPCGPCTEIFYDNGPDVWGGKPGTPEEDGDRYIEIWNNVFMEFERLEDGSLIPLPMKNVDTGMGLERISAILQGSYNNFEVDLFLNLIKDIEEKVGVKAEGDALFSCRIIADHLRCASFLIADGVLPSNEGRGYVLRRIMRRAMRHAHILGCKEPLMYKLFPALLKEMGEAYPELGRAESLIVQTLELEEKNFKRTLDKGLSMLSDESAKLPENGVLSGDIAFKLYDTYGFPMDLTQDILKAENKTVDVEGFEKSMEDQKEKARASWKGSGDAAKSKIWFDLKDKCGATDFLGYKTLSAEAKVLAVVEEDNNIYMITNQTPFYGESGGQVGDTGIIENDNFKAKVLDTTKEFGDLFIHHIEIIEGSVKEDNVVNMHVDKAHRDSVRANHSATHLVQKALQDILGNHVNQKGSYVTAERLRFDYSSPSALSKEDMIKVEKLVNEKIRENGEVVTKLMSSEEAFESGAMALFGEKYGDEVRVVSMISENDGFYSMELCGGTHVDRTGDIGCFKIISDSSVASGVRRIEAIT